VCWKASGSQWRENGEEGITQKQHEFGNIKAGQDAGVTCGCNSAVLQVAKHLLGAQWLHCNADHATLMV
jgi:hypothetical protein